MDGIYEETTDLLLYSLDDEETSDESREVGRV